MATERRQEQAERNARNRGLQEESERLQDADERQPHRAEGTEPERPTTPQEDADQDLAQLENPPQAEGPRERSNDAV